MKKWLFVALALILMPVAVLFAGCSTKDKEVVIRVNGDYVQWAYVGEDEWTNVISIEDIKNALGEGYQGEKGEQGEAGVDGRQVEFSKNETHIIWRYVGEDVWHNLVALSEIKGKDGETTISGPKHTVTFDSNGGTEIAPITNVSHLSAISKPKTPTRPGYAFDGWYSDGDMWNFNGCLVSKDITLTAKWNPLFTYTLKDGNATITGLTSFGQNLESICFASSIDGVEVKKVQISPSSNYLKSISFEEGIETIIMRLDGCTNLKSVTLPSSCKSIPIKLIHQDNLDIFTKYNGGLYLGTKDNPYFYLEAFDNYDEQKVEIHPNCEILFENFYSSQSFNTIKFDGTMSQFKNKAHFVEQSEQTSGVVYEIECKDGKFLSYDNYIECTYSTGKKVKYKPATRIENVYYVASVVISDGITEIPTEKFRNCSNLASIIIPNSVTIIGDEAFRGCSGLTEVHIADLVSWFKILFGTSDSNPLIYAHHLYLNGTELTEIGIPAGITKINSYALCGASSITSITIPSSVTSVGSGAFSNCNELIAITITNNLTSIGRGVLNNCGKLETINFDGSLSEFKAKKFNFGLGQFVKVVCTNGECLDTDAYFECTYSNGEVKYFKPNVIIRNEKVISVAIGDGVTSIEAGTFKDCSGLTSITIPSSVTAIGDYAFESCGALTEVHISDLKSWFNIKFNNVYANPLLYAQHLYLNGTELTEIEIPAGITKINDYALYGASSITSITIPNSVTSIGAYAFRDCSRLTSIIIPESVTSIGTDAFYDCRALTSIIISNSVTSIGSGAFKGCKKVFCEQGAEPFDWNANWSSGVESVYWYRETKPTEEGNFWHYVDGEPVIW